MHTGWKTSVLHAEKGKNDDDEWNVEAGTQGGEVMKKEELLELEALDGPRLAEIAHEKVKGKPTERAVVAEQILIGRWPVGLGKFCSADMGLDYYERMGSSHFQKKFK